MDAIIQSGMPFLALVIVIGWLAINITFARSERRGRRSARGFRSMKSPAQKQRERGDQVGFARKTRQPAAPPKGAKRRRRWR